MYHTLYIHLPITYILDEEAKYFTQLQTLFFDPKLAWNYLNSSTTN